MANQKIISVRIDDHSEELLAMMNKQTEVALKSIGEEMEGYAKKGTPVDTGRLRDSITYATSSAHDSPGGRAQGGDATPKGSVPKGEVQVGTNVEYAEIVEYSEKAHHVTGGAHFLRNAAANHSDHYKAIIEAAMAAISKM